MIIIFFSSKLKRQINIMSLTNNICYIQTNTLSLYTFSITTAHSAHLQIYQFMVIWPNTITSYSNY